MNTETKVPMTRAIWLTDIRAALKSCGGVSITWHRRHCTICKPDRVGLSGFKDSET